MKILGIDTATDVLGVAITDNKQLITEYRSNIKRAHAEKIINSIDKVLVDINITINDIDGIAISIGPGSFTGLRIGLSVVKGLTFDNDIPVAAVATLDALAYQAFYYAHQICPIIKAQADEAYTAIYQINNFSLERITDYQLLNINKLNNFITRKTLLINNSIKDISEYITDNKNIEIAPSESNLLSGLTIAQLGYEKFIKNETEEIETLEPFYLKDFIAKKGKIKI